MTPPILTTERLTLRGLTLADVPLFHSFYASDHSRFYGGPTTAAQSWRALSAYAGHWALRGYGPFAIERRDTGESIGMCGPWYPEGWPEPEMTYFLLEQYAGKGFASEALESCLHWAFRELGWTTVISAINPDNRASLALAKRCGAVADGQAEVVPHGTMDVYRYSPMEAA